MRAAYFAAPVIAPTMLFLLPILLLWTTSTSAKLPGLDFDPDDDYYYGNGNGFADEFGSPADHNFNSSALLPRGSLSLRLGVLNELTDIHDFVIITTLNNTSNETLKIINDHAGVLRPPGPHMFEFHQLSMIHSDDIFENACHEYPPYQNWAVKSLNDSLSPKDYTLLKPGQTKSVLHDISGQYTFHRAGPHVVRVNVNAEWFRIAKDDGSIAHAKAELSNHPEFGHRTIINVPESLVQPLPRGKEDLEQPKLPEHMAQDGSSPAPKRPRFLKCSADQKRIIAAAIDDAEAYIHNSISFLSNDEAVNSTQVKLWFGEIDINRLITIGWQYRNLQGHAPGLRYDCECDECGGEAYVYPETYGTIHLCPQFWRAPQTGSNSRAGVLIRETALFESVSSMEYHAEGRGKSLALAKTDPNDAFMNAHSYQHFAENATLPPPGCHHCE